ncbi:MAG: hypothetical protein J6J24_05255 [Clostridia bacterium]|nr:hypothetical protein [Clostridia bacterium]
MQKVAVFTHGIDIDGYGCAVLANLAYGENTQVLYADNFNLDEIFIKEWKRGWLNNFDKVFITDHCPSMNLCLKIQDDPQLLEKITVFDHHASRLEEQGSLDWVHIIDNNEKGKQSGTSLFFDYLAKNGLVNRGGSVQEFVELTRQYDTWEWTKLQNPIPNELNTLAMAIGREKYVENMTKKLSKQKSIFLFSAQDLLDIKTYKEEFKKQVEHYISQIKVIEFQGNKVGYIQIKDLFKNDIAQTVRTLPLSKEIDYLLMPIPDRGTVSLRSIKPDFDVSSVAKENGGGGHKAAASFPLYNLKIDTKKSFCKTLENV